MGSAGPGAHAGRPSRHGEEVHETAGIHYFSRWGGNRVAARRTRATIRSDGADRHERRPHRRDRVDADCMSILVRECAAASLEGVPGGFQD